MGGAEGGGQAGGIDQPLGGEAPPSCPPNSDTQGRRLAPALRNLLVSGMLHVSVDCAEGLGASALFGRPSV